MKNLSKKIQVDKKNRNLFNIGIIGAAAGTYYYLENTWWKDQSKEFHFDNGADLLYAKNIDKAGHFMV